MIPVRDLQEGARPLVDRIAEVLKQHRGQALTLREVASALGRDLSPLAFVELEAQCQVALVQLRAMRMVDAREHAGELHYFWIEGAGA